MNFAARKEHLGGYKVTQLQIINTLNSQFSRVFTKEDLENIPEMGSDPKPGLGSLIISEQGVLKQLCLLNPNKASGPDQIPPWFLKTFAADIAPTLTDIYLSRLDRQWHCTPQMEGG